MKNKSVLGCKLSAFGTDISNKRWKNEAMTTDSDTVVLYHQSSAMFISYAEFSGESWDFCNSILLPAWCSLCVYLHMISLDSKFWWPNSCHSTHTKIGSSNTNTFCYFCWIAMLLSWLLSPPPPTPYRSVEHHINSTPPPSPICECNNKQYGLRNINSLCFLILCKCSRPNFVSDY